MIAGRESPSVTVTRPESGQLRHRMVRLSAGLAVRHRCLSLPSAGNRGHSTNRCSRFTRRCLSNVIMSCVTVICLPTNCGNISIRYSYPGDKRIKPLLPSATLIQGTKEQSHCFLWEAVPSVPFTYLAKSQFE